MDSALAQTILKREWQRVKHGTWEKCSARLREQNREVRPRRDPTFVVVRGACVVATA